jgi:REP element-mobilizing transposase RayT
MSQSLAAIYVHLIFSTKNRKPWIKPEIEEELNKYHAGILRNLESPMLATGGTEDHIHILLRLSRKIDLATLVGELKAGSSEWIKSKGPEYKDFQWQNGYGAFSIGQSGVPDVKTYLANQKEHHRKKTLQEEFREFLRKYEIEFDERYVWD